MGARRHASTKPLSTDTLWQDLILVCLKGPNGIQECPLTVQCFSCVAQCVFVVCIGFRFIYIYIYMYIYVCLCVCVCVFVRVRVCMCVYITNIYNIQHKTSEILQGQGSRMRMLHIMKKTTSRKQTRSLFVQQQHGSTHPQVQITITLPQFHRHISYFNVDSEQHAKDARVQCVSVSVYVYYAVFFMCCAVCIGVCVCLCVCVCVCLCVLRLIGYT